MKMAEVSARPPQLVQQLVEVWQRSVQATHLFLSAPEIAAIRTYVPQALCGPCAGWNTWLLRRMKAAHRSALWACRRTGWKCSF